MILNKLVPPKQSPKLPEYSAGVRALLNILVTPVSGSIYCTVSTAEARGTAERSAKAATDAAAHELSKNGNLAIVAIVGFRPEIWIVRCSDQAIVGLAPKARC